MDNKPNNSHLLRKIIEEKVNTTLDEPLSKLINESESPDVEEIIKKLDLTSVEDDILETQKPLLWTSNLNSCDYSAIIEGLNSNSTITKLKVLDKLLNIHQIIDTKQKLWGDLSQSLRKCIVSANNDIFTRTLKIHHRIVAFPNSSCDGYLSLLKSAFLLLNSRYFTDINKNRVFQTLQLILNAQNVVIKFLLHASRSLIDEILAAFIGIFTFRAVFDWLGLLDPQTNWLRNFCYGGYIRNSFFTQLKEKHPEFIKSIVTSFKKYLNSDSSSGIHYGYFLLYFWKFANNLKFCPDEASFERTLEITVIKINQKKRHELCEFGINFFNQNPSLLSPKILDLLVEPLGTANRNNIRNVLENNLTILTIINNLTKTHNSKILFGACPNLKGRSRQLARNSTNLPQKIVDLLAILLKSNQNDISTLVALMSCCAGIFESHPVAIIHVNPSKLLQNLHDFYRGSWKNPDLKNASLRLFKFFYSHYAPVVRILGCSNEIVDDLFDFAPSGDLKIIITRIGCQRPGFEVLKRRYGQIVKPYLEEIWCTDDSGEDNDFVRFILFLFVVKTSTRATVALLSDDDEGTIIESNEKSLVLVELLEKSLNISNNCEAIEEFLGLLTMKVMIINLDLLLYLLSNHQMQDKLKSLEDDERIIDSQSCLRRNILISLEVIGFVDNKLNDKIFEMTVPHTFENFNFGVTSEFGAFLQSFPNNRRDYSWLLQARKAFKNSLESVVPSVLIILLDKIPKSYVYRKTDLQWPSFDSVYYQMHPEEFFGISIIINFGLKTGLLNNNVLDGPNHDDKLTLLIKQSRAFIGHQPEAFSNFDWFVGIIYIICHGHLDQCKSVLINFTNTFVTSLVWATFSKEFDHTFQEHFYQHLDVILEENCSSFQALKVSICPGSSCFNPISLSHVRLMGGRLFTRLCCADESVIRTKPVHNCLVNDLTSTHMLYCLMLGISSEGLVRSWLNQCFFNYLPFEEICNFLAFSVLYPPECLLYYMVTVFQHINERICIVTHSPTVENILNMTEMSSFKLSNNIHRIEKLAKQYRNSHKL